VLHMQWPKGSVNTNPSEYHWSSSVRSLVCNRCRLLHRAKVASPQVAPRKEAFRSDATCNASERPSGCFHIRPR
jgi:hypothetical protein